MKQPTWIYVTNIIYSTSPSNYGMSLTNIGPKFT